MIQYTTMTKLSISMIFRWPSVCNQPSTTTTTRRCREDDDDDDGNNIVIDRRYPRNKAGPSRGNTVCQRYRYNRYSRYRYCFYSYTKALPALIIDCLFSLSTMPYYYYYYYRCKTCSATASFWVVLSIILLCCLDDSVVHGLLSSAGGSSSSSSSDSRSLLAAEQYAAQARRAELERLLMLNNNKHGVPSELQEIDFSVKERQPTTLKKSSSSGGFGKTTTNKWSKSKAIAEQQAKALERDGVLRINNALSMKTCQALRLHILQEIKSVYALYEESLLDNSESPFVVEDYYGIEPSRSCRSDLLLSMQPCAVSMALQELFDESNGKLRALYETLVTNKGVMYELAGVVTSPGSARQCIHPDLPYQHPAPLYVVFVALQDVTSSMGPTTFLKGSNTLAAKDAYCNGEETLDALISDSHIVEATMKMGDLVVFDARTMHCGNANLGDAQANEDESLDRALFNFSFRNPQVVGSLGYKGSMRPDYTKQQITLESFLSVVDGKTRRNDNNLSSFDVYGNGLQSTSS